MSKIASSSFEALRAENLSAVFKYQYEQNNKKIKIKIDKKKSSTLLFFLICFLMICQLFINKESIICELYYLIF